MPLAREEEKDWLVKQAEYCRELKMLSEVLDCPIGCAGDIFDKWNAPAKLCNFLLDILPKMYAVPGQHDLPYHSYELIEDSGFANLFKAGKIEYLPKDGFTGIFKQNIEIHGFGWEQELKTPKENNPHTSSNVIKIALVHRYCWVRGKHYLGSEMKQELNAPYLAEKLKGFDFAIFGDNHIPFEWKGKDPDLPIIYNCGSFMRRKRDEMHRPSVGVIFSDYTIHRYYLKSADNDLVSNKAEDNKVDPDEVFNSVELMEALVKMANMDKPISFPTAVRHALRSGNVGKHIRKIVLESLENKE